MGKIKSLTKIGKGDVLLHKSLPSRLKIANILNSSFYLYVMEFKFNCYGHENILSLHKNTLEFTKDCELSKEGDCIVGVKADFDFDKLMLFVQENKGKKILGEMVVDDLKDEFSFILNPDFCDKEEIVIRKSDFNSERTLGFRVDKAAKDIKREIIDKIKDSNVKFRVVFNTKE